MPARRKSIEMLSANGAYAHNPDRLRAREAELESKPGALDPLGDPPTEWTAGAEINSRCQRLLLCWAEIVEQIPDLAAADRDVVEFACYLKDKIRRASAGYGKATSGDFSQLEKYLDRLRQNAKDRRALGGRKAAKEASSEWDDFAGARKRHA